MAARCAAASSVLHLPATSTAATATARTRRAAPSACVKVAPENPLKYPLTCLQRYLSKEVKLLKEEVCLSQFGANFGNIRCLKSPSNGINLWLDLTSTFSSAVFPYSLFP